MNSFLEFGKGECVKISSRRNTYFQYRDNKDRLKTKKIKANTTLDVQTNFEIGDHYWVHVRNYGWCAIPMKDWKITKVWHPRHHAHCLEYAEERTKWLNGQPNRLFDEDFAYKPLGPDPMSIYGEFGRD